MLEDSKAMGSKTTSYSSNDVRNGFDLQTQEPFLGLLSSLTDGIKEFAYTIIDVIKGRYDR